MKVNKYKEIITKVDTDQTMDRRIKNQIFNYVNSSEEANQKRFHNHNGMNDNKSEIKFFHSLPHIKIFRAALPSIAFLVFMVIILLGIKTKLANETTSSKQATDSSKTSKLDSIDNSPINTIEDLFERTFGDKTPETEILKEGSTEEQSLDPTPEQNEAPVEEETEDPLKKTTEDPDIKTPQEQNTDTVEYAKTADDEYIPVNPGDFYFAYFDVTVERNVKASIPFLIVRLLGNIDTINPEDLTDMILTKDGVPIENYISLTPRVEHFTWKNQEISDFYFEFSMENREPGVYSMTGKYKGYPFSVYEKIIEESVNETPANPNDLLTVTWGIYPDASGNPQRISDLIFIFDGVQNAFYQSDLTDLKVTLNGLEISCSFQKDVTRYLEKDLNRKNTSFHLSLTKELTESGTYAVTGNYKGIPFTSSFETTIP